MAISIKDSVFGNHCLKCGTTGKTKVTGTNRTERTIKRYRQCFDCGQKFTTISISDSSWNEISKMKEQRGFVKSASDVAKQLIEKGSFPLYNLEMALRVVNDHCPECRNVDAESRTLETRTFEESGVIRRRRECCECVKKENGQRPRWTTYEVRFDSFESLVEDADIDWDEVASILNVAHSQASLLRSAAIKKPHRKIFTVNP